ncbi:hypothetical protein INT48_006173 [Thamnidium elegans]|uniref:Carboxymuconolactone decarboxylase-like domain-containing protein n=1 Tax=Thamnidium elegans TaxID=101142 RepID=A0A8H7SLT5_9FUNG|nr:hypothetical protein INT48_006173 [Thamnidium elegans]
MKMNTPDYLIYIELAKLIYTKDICPSLAAMLLCVSLGASNHPLGIPVIVNKYLNTVESLEEKIQWVEYTRNAIMKSTAICGIARGINSHGALFNSLPKEYQDLLSKTPTLDKEVNEWIPRSLELLDTVYGDSLDRVLGNVKAIGSDLYFWAFFVYGNVFYNRSLTNLIETELVIIATLIQMDTLPQLHDHLDNARRVGATDVQVTATQLIGNSVKNAF